MKSKKFLTASILASAIVSSTAFAVQPATNGNGLPKVDMSDSFLLNIHAVKDCPSNGFDGSNSHTIVVQGLGGDEFDAAVLAHQNNLPDLSDLNDIFLTPSDSADSFQVRDGNACDNDPALLALPPLVATTYQVYLKLVGKPGEKSNPVLCARDIYITEVGDYYCNTGTVRVRNSGKDAFVNVTDELLTLLDDDLNSTFVFKDPDGSYFWDWSATMGAKAQVRFVPID